VKRLMPSSLITYLQTNPGTARADLFSISLPTGTVLNVTSGQFDITVPSGTNGWSGSTTTFYASTYGVWSRGAITSDASFDLHANTMDLTCIPQLGTAYPGCPTGILNAALNGLFDACQVTVQTVYMPLGQYGNVSNGVETKFVGQISNPTEISRNKVKFECADYLYLLNVKIPTRIIQSNCTWGFADTNCALNPATYTVNFTAASGTTGWVMIPTSSFSEPTGYYTQGVVKCLTGANSGLSQCVKLHDASGHLNLMYPWIFAPSVGDTFSVIAGCDKSVATCNQKFSNQVHFGGMPFCPPPQNVV
jgi:uncharacterized phage protein (TIGR02218 family)